MVVMAGTEGVAVYHQESIVYDGPFTRSERDTMLNWIHDPVRNAGDWRMLGSSGSVVIAVTTSVECR